MWLRVGGGETGLVWCGGCGGKEAREGIAELCSGLGVRGIDGEVCLLRRIK
jgi:hypothetical protein